jgi:hypothetical protein
MCHFGERRAKLTVNFFALILGCSLCSAIHAQNSVRYHVDPSWPKQLPNNWILGHVESVIVDKDDHIWVLHFTGSIPRDEAGLAQQPPLSECCIPAPAVLEFDPQGTVLSSWGGPKYVPHWPAAEHGMWVDKGENVWITGNWTTDLRVHPPGMEKVPADRNALKFSKDGKLLLEIGHPSMDGVANNQDTNLLGGVSSIQVDDDAHEVYFADGYINRRIVVYDSETGKFKRGWGAYGMPLSEIENSKPKSEYNPTDPPSKQFRGPLVGLRLANDGLLYVSDRENDRIQVFTKQGKFIKEFFVAPKTLGEGSPMMLAFSRDPQQKYLFVADGSNNVVRILDRNDGSELGAFGHRGHNAGQFSYLDGIDIDSHGNLYTGEVKYNNRLQKFIPGK